MVKAALVIVCVLLAGLAVLQILVAAGLPYGHLTWGGVNRVLPVPLRIASAASVLIYLGMIALLFSRVGVISGGDSRWVRWLTWALVIFLVVNAVGNLLSSSSAERWTMTPVSLLLAGAIAVIALRS